MNYDARLNKLEGLLPKGPDLDDISPEVQAKILAILKEADCFPDENGKFDLSKLSDSQLDRIEQLYNECRLSKTIENMTDDELARTITGDPSTQSDDLSNENLEYIIQSNK